MKLKAAINFSILLFMYLSIFVSCKTEKDFFPLELEVVENISLVAVDCKGTYETISKNFKIEVMEHQKTIIDFLNNKGKLYSYEIKPNDILFLLIIRRDGDDLEFPIYYNKRRKRSSIKLYSNGYNGHLIGYYSTPGLYEYLDKTFDFETIIYN
jgi:hypothetical protein